LSPRARREDRPHGCALPHRGLPRLGHSAPHAVARAYSFGGSPGRSGAGKTFL
jgi:hypothetical protein